MLFRSGLLGELAAVPGLADALHAARPLPPTRYAEDVWSIVDALLDVLPRAAAELTFAFGDAGAIDFTQATMAALKPWATRTRRRICCSSSIFVCCTSWSTNFRTRLSRNWR